MNYTEKLKGISENTKRIFTNSVEMGERFSSLHKEAISEKKLSIKDKELISLGIAIVIRCEGCIVSHLAACKKAGVTLEEIYETIEVAILMGGGPSVMYGGIAAECAEEFYL